MSLAQKSLSVLSRDILFTLIGLVTGVVVARTLGPAGVGIWAALDLINNYGRVFGGPRLEIASVYFLNQKQDKRGHIFFLINIVSVTFGICLASLLILNLPTIRGVLFRETVISGSLVALFIGHFPFLFLKRNYHYFLLAREDITSFNRMLIIQEITYPAVAISLLVFFNWGLWSFVAGMYAGSLASLAYGIPKIHRREKMVPNFDLKLLGEMFSFSMKVYSSEAMGFLNIYLSNLLCAVLLTPAGLAFFSMGKGKAEWANRIASAAGVVLYPRVSNLNGVDQDASQTTTLAFRLCLITLTVASLLFSVLIYPATIFLYGREFLPLVPVFLIVIPGVVIHGAAGLLRQYFLGIGRADLPMKIAIVPLILQGTLCTLLIPIAGFRGGAIAVSLTLILTAVIMMVVYKKSAGISLAELMRPKSRDIRILWDILKGRITGFIHQFRFVLHKAGLVAERSGS